MTTDENRLKKDHVIDALERAHRMALAGFWYSAKYAIEEANIIIHSMPVKEIDEEQR